MKNHFFIKSFLCSLLLWPAIQLFCGIHDYTTNNNFWYVNYNQFQLNKKWFIQLEEQFRRSDWSLKDQQLLLRTSLNYNFAENNSIGGGFCFVETWPYGEFAAKSKFPEFRTFEQWQSKRDIKRVESFSRFRLEQRWVKSPVADSTGTHYAPGDAVYSNRARVYQRLSYPFNFKKADKKPFSLSIYDEVFVNFGKNVLSNMLDQNRLYGGVGYNFNPVHKLELGFLFQSIYKGDGIKVERNLTPQITYSTKFNFSKS